MKRILVQGSALLVCLLLALPAAATPHRGSVGLGVAVGVAFPHGSTDRIQSNDWDGSFNWGFYVNIPLIWTFHLTPSAELYRLNVAGAYAHATDISLAFKFIIPLSILDIYLGFVPGLTAAGDVTDFNVGGLVGVSFNIISNIDLFIQAKYKFIIESSTNMRVLHLNGGVLFNF
jgi:hypothetical protein